MDKKSGRAGASHPGSYGGRGRRWPDFRGDEIRGQNLGTRARGQRGSIGEEILEGRGFVSADHVSEQFGKRYRRVVFVERTHDLCADGEFTRRTPYGCS